MNARFNVVDVKDGIVYLLDMDGRSSITNDAEQVYQWCIERFPNHRVVYEDTYGDKTEIVGKPSKTTWMGTSKISFVQWHD